MGLYAFEQYRIMASDDLCGKDPRILGCIKRHGSNGDSVGHLKDGKDGIPAIDGIG